jgi:hypothetical protein
MKTMNPFLMLILPLITAGALPVIGADEAASNRVANGGFEEADPASGARPLGWDTLDGLGVTWEAETNGGGNRVIRLDTAVSEQDYVARCKAAGLDKWVFPDAGKGPIAGTYGLSYYSDSFPAATGQAYRLTFRYLGHSGGAKVWVRGYGLLRGEERRRYDTIVNCRTAGPGWKTFSQCFHPTRQTPGVTRLRIMLYAYWPPGVYAFDDVAVVPVSDAEWQADHRENE